MAVFVNGPLAFYTLTRTLPRSQDQLLSSARVTPPIEVARSCIRQYTVLARKSCLGRGLELLLEDGCLRGERASGATGYARWKAQRPVAFLNRKKSKHSDKKRLLELWLSNHVTPTFDAGPLSSEASVPWGPPIKYDSHNFLLA